MSIFNSFKKGCIALSLLMLLSCGGGGESSAPNLAPNPAPTTSPNISLVESSFNFTGVVLDKSADHSFEMKNTGVENLKIGQISNPNSPFSIYSDTCSNTTLAPSETCSLGTRFSPTTQGPSTSILSIPSSDPDSSTVDIHLNGEGYGLDVWINQIDVSGCQVTAEVSVTNPQMNVVLTSLTKDNFVLKQNGQLQNIDTILNVVQSNVSVVLALDWSISTSNVASEIKAGATSFINRLTDNDEAAMCKFNAAIDFYPKTSLFTVATASGKASLITYINTNISRPSGTALYDVVMRSVDRAAQGTTGNQRAVIVLSDGVNVSTSSSTLDQAIAQATAKGIPVFTIYYVDQNYSSGNYGKTEVMQRLARETGGQYYNSADADLTTIFLQISNVLSNKYSITYTSSTCSGNVTLDMRATLNDLYGQDSRMVTFP